MKPKREKSEDDSIVGAFRSLRSYFSGIHLTDEEKDELLSRVELKMSLEAQIAPVPLVIDRRPDVLILALYFVKKFWNKDVWGRTKLVKLLLLLGREGNCDRFIPDFYDHYAYDFGAFDDAVPRDAEQLAARGIIDQKPPTQPVKTELSAPQEKQVGSVYHLTQKGEKVAESLLASAQKQCPELISRIEEVVRLHGNKSTDELLKYTYSKYPDTAVNSKIRERYLDS